MKFRIFQKEFLETPDKSCIQFQDGNGKFVRIVRFRTQNSFEWLYFSHTPDSEKDISAMYCLGYLVGCRDLYIYESHVQEFRSLFDGEIDKIETVHDAFQRTRKVICQRIIELSEDIALPVLNTWMQKEALEQAYMAYVRGTELELDISLHEFSEGSVLIHSLFKGYGGTFVFAQEYFDKKRDYCLRWLAIYRQAEGLMKAWKFAPDCAASLSRVMYQAAVDNNVLHRIMVRVGKKEYSTTLSNLGNVFVNDDKTYQLSMLPVKDKAENKTIMVAKDTITELATSGGKVFWTKK